MTSATRFGSISALGILRPLPGGLVPLVVVLVIVILVVMTLLLCVVVPALLRVGIVMTGIIISAEALLARTHKSSARCTYPSS